MGGIGSTWIEQLVARSKKWFVQKLFNQEPFSITMLFRVEMVIRLFLATAVGKEQVPHPLWISDPLEEAHKRNQVRLHKSVKQEAGGLLIVPRMFPTAVWLEPRRKTKVVHPLWVANHTKTYWVWPRKKPNWTNHKNSTNTARVPIPERRLTGGAKEGRKKISFRGQFLIELDSCHLLDEIIDEEQKLARNEDFLSLRMTAAALKSSSSISLWNHYMRHILMTTLGLFLSSMLRKTQMTQIMWVMFILYSTLWAKISKIHERMFLWLTTVNIGNKLVPLF